MRHRSRIKIGTALDKDLFRELKEHAAREGRAVNEIIEDALERYVHAGSLRRELQVAAAERYCSMSFGLSTKELKQLLDEDYYDQ
jgi:metal-responsive CopG/Arc/MetJ family transcriptional regulator